MLGSDACANTFRLKRKFRCYKTSLWRSLFSAQNAHASKHHVAIKKTRSAQARLIHISSISSPFTAAMARPGRIDLDSGVSSRFSSYVIHLDLHHSLDTYIHLFDQFTSRTVAWAALPLGCALKCFFGTSRKRVRRERKGLRLSDRSSLEELYNTPRTEARPADAPTKLVSQKGHVLIFVARLSPFSRPSQFSPFQSPTTRYIPYFDARILLPILTMQRWSPVFASPHDFYEVPPWCHI